MTSREWLTAAREPRWRALAGAFVTVVLAQGLSNSFPVFLLPISDDLGGLRSLSAAVFSAHNLVMGLVGTSWTPSCGGLASARSCWQAR